MTQLDGACLSAELVAGVPTQQVPPGSFLIGLWSHGRGCLRAGVLWGGGGWPSASPLTTYLATQKSKNQIKPASWSEVTGIHSFCPAHTPEESLCGEKSDRHILQERSDFVWCMVMLTS